MKRYLIIDDESIAHDIIRSYADQVPYLEFMQSCYDAWEATDYLQHHPVDLVFLDLNMPRLTGFEFLRSLPHPPQVVVTTAYREHALEGHELNVVDYLLKPFGFERFLKAVNRVRSTESPTAPAASATDGRLFFYADKRHVQVRAADILYVEAAGNYMKLVQAESQLLVRQTFAEVLKTLPAGRFVRVHKSYLVALSHVDYVEGNQIYSAGHRIPVGKAYRQGLLSLLKGD